VLGRPRTQQVPDRLSLAGPLPWWGKQPDRAAAPRRVGASSHADRVGGRQLVSVQGSIGGTD
jgi:hypothetical protein